MESRLHEERVCHRCGIPVSAQARFCESCGAPAGSPERRSCKTCGSVLSTTARFCPQCGAQASGRWGADLRGGWEQLRARATAVDWARVARVALPIAGLLLAGLVGYLVGQRAVKPSASQERVVSATRGWREQAPGSARPAGSGEQVEHAQTRAGLEPEPGQPLKSSPPVRRLRDFRITASSWELVHPPAHAVDGDPYTFWHAWQTEKFAEGEWLTLTFPSERVVSRIGLLPGRIDARAGEDGRVRSLLVKAPGAPSQKLIFADRPGMQYRDLPRPVRTRQLILRVANVLPGRRSRHVVIPEVQVWGHPAATRVTRAPVQ